MSRIPDESEYQAWRTGYRQRYGRPILELGDAAIKAAGGLRAIGMREGGTPLFATTDPGKRAKPHEDESIPLAQHEVEYAVLGSADLAMDAAESAAITVSSAQERGYRIGRAGMGANNNPFPDDRGDNFYAWYKGWRQGNRDHEWRKWRQFG